MGVALATVVACAVPIRARGQEAQNGALPGPGDAITSSPDEQVAAYIDRLGLKRLLAEDLAARVKVAQGEAKAAIADRLGRLYVELLTGAAQTDERRKWEDRSRELLRLVPESDSFELRLSLAKAMYLQAEAVVERRRLRLTSGGEVTEAERVLRTLKPQLEEIGLKVNRRVDALERLEEEGEGSDRLSTDLADARRIRSQAFYYAGWTDYYISFLTGNEEAASDALKAFGWLFNSKGNRPVTLEKLPKGLLKFEHVARAAIGCGLAMSAKGNDTGAARWFDAVEEEPETPDAVRAQLLPRRIAVYSAAKRWADLERLIRTTRKSDRAGGGAHVEYLPANSARLLAVVTLEADKAKSKGVIEGLSTIALGDLVSRGEIGHVLDLVEKYGTAPIGETGFIVRYVRGLQQYDRARAAHKGVASERPISIGNPDVTAVSGGSQAAGADADEPATSPEVIAFYRQAAVLLDAAVHESDAEFFKVERSKGAILVGLALYYAGDLGNAADRFADAATLAATKEQGAEASWLAVVALDKAVEKGAKDLEKRREEAATMYLQTYPDSERAARLLLRRAIGGLLKNEEALRVLMGVSKDSPLYPAARQHASRLLYAQYRSARGTERDFAAMRFVGIAEEALTFDRKAAMEGSGKAAAEAAQRVVVRARQILDALLNGQSPDFARAEATLDVLNGVAVYNNLDLSAFKQELLFRKFQIALAKDDSAGAASLIEQLRADGGQFAVAADQLMYRGALTRKQRGQNDGATRKAIVLYGSRLIDRMKGEPGAMKDPVVLALHEEVAQAAAGLGALEQDTAMRDLSIRLDKAVLAAQPQSSMTLRRLAGTSEETGDNTTALDCWRVLLSGLQAPAPQWYEARYQSLRLLFPADAPRAREAMRQHVLLYPDYGPDPWGKKLKELDRSMGPILSPTEPAATAPTPKPAGGPP